ncbi:MAG: AraC family transcriptional regulator [Planctomycetaceae bacterium]|nr:MAG: AraC family transcriptional regulator [Planctomycetaceae bacterium]
MIDTPEIVQFAGQPAACIRVTIPRAEIQQAMGAAITELMTAVTAQGISPAGPIFSHHLQMDPAIFDFEVGVPVDRQVASVGRVTAGQLPAGIIARAIYRGSYDGLGSAWGEFDDWLRVAGYMPAPNLWESYVAGPESSSDPSNWRTELNRPLIGQI